jgi:hypothetical protein
MSRSCAVLNLSSDSCYSCGCFFPDLFQLLINTTKPNFTNSVIVQSLAVTYKTVTSITSSPLFVMLWSSQNVY